MLLIPCSAAFLCQSPQLFFDRPGEKVVTDVTANSGRWEFLCAEWSSGGGEWAIFKNGKLADSGEGLAQGQVVQG